MVFQHYTDKIHEEDKDDLSTNEADPFWDVKLGFDFAVSKTHIQLGIQTDVIGIGCHFGVTF